MSKINFFSLIIFLLLPILLPAQSVPELNGARAAALGSASVILSDTWAIQNNIGALDIEDPQIAFGYNTRLRLGELTTFGAMLGYPFKQGIASASFSRFGTGAYHIQEAGLGFTHKIRYISIGAKVNYLQHSVESFESHSTVVLEAGGKAELLPQLHFAAHAYNLSQSSFSTKNQGENLVPLLLKAGLAYLPGEDVQLLIQTLKHLQHPARFSAGLEYRLREALSLRTGLITAPVVASFGIGFRPGKFSFDYAFRHHSTIGAAHHISIGYFLKQREEQ